jgi:hypothetical protein
MSNWDFGYGRQEPADRPEPRYPPPYPGGNSYAGENSHPGDQADPYDLQAAPYPLTYERDVFDGPVSGPASPWSPGPRRAAVRPTSPGRAMPPRPHPRQAGPRQAVPGQARPSSAPPWASVPPPAGRSAADRYTGGQPRYAGDRGYPTGAYPGGQRGYAGGPRGFGAEPSRGFHSAGQEGDEPWLTAPRAPRRDGRWWDPDSWSGWQHWLIAVGVAVAAALIGAALVLLTGTHASASAATGLPLPLIAAPTFISHSGHSGHTGLRPHERVSPRRWRRGWARPGRGR